MSESDLRYYQRRLAEELSETQRSEQPQVRAVHRKLAEMYRERIVTLSEVAPVTEQSESHRQGSPG
jgi:hypothetical protein